MNYLDEDKPFTLRQWLGLEASESRPKLVWWRPPIRDVLRQMDWWWALLLLPIATGVGLIVVAAFWRQSDGMLWWLGGKILLLTLAVPLIAWGHLRLKAIKARSDPFCIHCGWTLIGLPAEGNCPECGRPYRMAVVQMFRRDPQWVIAFWRFTGRPPPVELFDAWHGGRKG